MGRPSYKEETILAIYLYVEDFLILATVLPYFHLVGYFQLKIYWDYSDML